MKIGIMDVATLRLAREGDFSSLTLEQAITLLEVAIENGASVSARMSTFHVHDPLETRKRLTIDIDPDFVDQLEETLDRPPATPHHHDNDL